MRSIARTDLSSANATMSMYASMRPGTYLERRFRADYGPQCSSAVHPALNPKLDGDLATAASIRSSPEPVRLVHRAIAVAVAGGDTERQKALGP